MLRLIANDTMLSRTDDVQVTVNPAIVNQAPVVLAGSNQFVVLPAAANLAATVTDDGLPSGKVTVAWSKVSGTGTVTFANATNLVTTATMSTGGVYVLRIVASDGLLSRTSSVTITANRRPVVSAGTNQTVFMLSLIHISEPTRPY